MWEQIANDINDTFELSKSAQQVENRFKTILKRKKFAVDNNKKSGAKRQKIEFEEELERIAYKDNNSLQPEIMKDQKHITVRNSNKDKQTKQKTETVLETLKKIHMEKQKQKDDMHKEREENKERRHREKLEILRELFKKS